MNNSTILRSLSLAAVVGLTACSQDGDTVINETSTLVETRADAIAAELIENWTDNHQSINTPSTEDLDDARGFASPGGAAIVAWTNGDDGNEYLSFSYLPPNGGAIAEVSAVGSFDSSPFSDSVDEMVVAWLPGGDAVIAFIAEEARDDAVLNDDSSDRVYLGFFNRSEAAKALGSNGERFGFSAFTAVDSNVVDTDDNNIDRVFMATNLVDGEVQYNGSDYNLESSGPKGDSNQDAAPFVAIGWIGRDASFDQEVEIGFVDLDALTFGSVALVAFPEATDSRTISTTLRTSGRDILFEVNDTLPTPTQEHAYLVRVDGESSTVGTPIDIARGVNTGANSSMDIIALIGDGYRALNGQDSTWVLYTENNYADVTVTQADRDLLLARISDAGAVEILDIDHNPMDAAFSASPGSYQWNLSRGATRLWTYWRQANTPGSATDSNQSLFGRVVRLNEAASLAASVSAEFTVNTALDSDNNGDTDVNQFELITRNPFVDPQVNNDASFAAFVQEIDGDSDGRAVFCRAAVADVTTSPPTVAQQAIQTVIANQDTGWGTPLIHVIEGTDAMGEGLVFGAMQGNNVDDNSVVGSFNEGRPFFSAANIPSGGSAQPIGLLQIGSDAPAVSQLSSGQSKVLSNDGMHGIVTPRSAAQRDFSFDSDTAMPRYAYMFFQEYRDHDGSEEGARWMSRCLNLTTGAQFATGEQRFEPTLESMPDVFGARDGQFDDLDDWIFELTTDGNRVTGIFNTEFGDDDDVEGILMVNTIDPDGGSDAALLSNDAPWSISDHGNPSDEIFILRTPGLNGDDTIGTRAFWVRDSYVDDAATEVYSLQARRLTGGNLPSL